MTSNLKRFLGNTFLCFSLSSMMSVLYFEEAISPHSKGLSGWFAAILDGEAQSPYNYRVLVPLIFKFFEYLLPLPQVTIFFTATFCIFFVSISSLVILYSHSELKHLKNIALLYCSFFIIVTFPAGGVQPWSYLDIGIYALAYYCLLAKRFNPVIYSFLVIVAVLNRETGVLLSIIPLLFKLIDLKDRVQVNLYKKELSVIAVALISFVFIRWFQGPAEHAITVSEVIFRNFAMPAIAVTIMVYLGAFCWLLMGDKINVSPLEKAFISILFINFILIFLFGLFREIRMFVPYVFLLGIFVSRRLKNQV